MTSLLEKWRKFDKQEYSPWAPYDHAHFARRRRILRWALGAIGFSLLAKLDEVSGLENVPTSGPA